MLCVDNQAALTMIDAGGSWRTRYYAVRAARLHDEMAAGNISVRYCVTVDMVADALTKLCSAVVLEMARRAMEGQFPPLPGAEKVVQITDQTWWGALLLAPRPDLSQFRRNNQKKKVLSTTPGRAVRADMAGDGPASDERRDAMWKVIFDIWEQNKSPNMSKAEHQQ